jgi:hypothetical protein
VLNAIFQLYREPGLEEHGEDLYRLLPAIQSISFIYEYNRFKMKVGRVSDAV